MAVIIKKLGSVNNMDKKSAYTWGACILAFFLIVVTLLSLVGGEEEKTNNFAALKSKGYDLAAMPFATDLAEQELLNGPYSDIAANPVNSTLFSMEDKEERQAEDEENGEPGAADEEYAQADIERQISQDRNRGGTYERQSTYIPQLQGSGSMAGSGMGGFSGGNSVWAPANDGAKNKSNGGSYAPSGAALAGKLGKGDAGRSLLNVNAASKEKGLEGLANTAGAFAGDEKKDLKIEAEQEAPVEAAVPELPSESDIGKAAEKQAEAQDPGDKSKDKDNNNTNACSGGNSFKAECLFQNIVMPMLIAYGGKALHIPDAVTTGVVNAYMSQSRAASAKENTSNKG